VGFRNWIVGRESFPQRAAEEAGEPALEARSLREREDVTSHLTQLELDILPSVNGGDSYRVSRREA